MRQTKNQTKSTTRGRNTSQGNYSRRRHPEYQTDYDRSEYDRNYDQDYDQEFENYSEEEFEGEYRGDYGRNYNAERNYDTPGRSRRNLYEPYQSFNRGERGRARRSEFDQDYERSGKYPEYDQYSNQFEDDRYFHEFENAFEQELRERNRYSPSRRNSLEDEGYSDYDDYTSEFNEGYNDESFRPGRRRQSEQYERGISYQRYPRVGSYGTDRGYDQPRRRPSYSREQSGNYSNGMDMGVTQRRGQHPSHNLRNLRDEQNYLRNENRSNRRRGTKRSSSI